MSNIAATSAIPNTRSTDPDRDHTPAPVETKSSFKTTELIVYLVVAIGIIITGAVIGTAGGGGADHFNALQAAQLITLLTSGSMIARGLAKSGSRQPRD